MTNLARLSALAVLALAIGLLPEVGQAQSTGMMIAEEDAPAPSSNSVVLEAEATPSSVGVNPDRMRRFAETDGPVQPVSMNVNSMEAAPLPSRPFPAPQMSTQRKVIYIVGGALVVGGAILGIAALSGDDGGQQIPAPPGRP